MTTISAVYEGGVFRPTEKFDLAEGAEVRLTVFSPPESGLPEPAPADAELIRRLQACRSIDEWATLMATQSEDDEGYDIIGLLNENRKFSGWHRSVGPSGAVP